MSRFGTCPHCSRWTALGHSVYIGPRRDKDAWSCLDCHLSAQWASGEGYPPDKRKDAAWKTTP